jgi:hypothetical protein
MKFGVSWVQFAMWIFVLLLIGVGLGLYPRIGPHTLVNDPEAVRRTMAMVVSLAILGSALYVFLSDKYPDASQKWAFGAIGLVAGYWLPMASQ